MPRAPAYHRAMSSDGDHGFRAPDVLVLGGGGVLGIAWMAALLAALDEAAGFDARECESFVGTSAGAVLCASLASGRHPRDQLGALPAAAPSAEFSARGGPSPVARALRLGGALSGVVAAPLAATALQGSAWGGALMRAAVLGRISPGRRSLAELNTAIGAFEVPWDGRLGLTAVEVESGRRVIFDGSQRPEVPVATAVQASCAIPGYFAPVPAGGRTYVDGGAWSPTNLDAAHVRRGTRVLCLNPTGSLGANGELPIAIGPLSRTLAGLEALALRSRGAHVTTVAPDAASVAAIGPSLMDGRRRAEVVAAGVAQGRRLAA